MLLCKVLFLSFFFPFMTSQTSSCSYCGGNRQDALRELGSTEQRRDGDALGWLGWFCGCSFVLLVVLVFQLAVSVHITTYSIWPAAHLVFRFHFLLAIFVLGIAVNVRIWARIPVNWSFIFGVNRGRHVEARHVALVGFQLSTISLTFANCMALHMNLVPGRGVFFFVVFFVFLLIDFLFASC